MEKKYLTKVLNSSEIHQAVDLIKKGEVVAFPTETVYGLGANALDINAIKKIYLAKGRPSDNPLIVHIGKKNDIYALTNITEDKTRKIVSKLILKFWPGPLTLILPKTQKIPSEITGGLDSVAIRMPKNKIALKLITSSGVPIAAPSANISGKPSSTSFKHVFQDFEGKIPAIIKAKSSKIGIESTVLDLTQKNPTILRPGGVSFEEIKEILPNVRLHKNKKTIKVKSPGMKYKHYSPNAKIYLFEFGKEKEFETYVKKFKKEKIKFKIIKTDDKISLSKNLFKEFRESDEKNFDYILIFAVKEEGLGLGLMNRIRKAATKIIR